MKVNFLFGPAAAGKTTFFELMKTRGHAVHCNSEQTYLKAARDGRVDIARAKADKENPELSEYNRMAARYTIINYIENELISRVYGSRKDFVCGLFEAQAANYADKTVWISVFDHAEFEIFKTLVSDYSVYELSRHGVGYGGDGRQSPPEDETVIQLVARFGNFYYANLGEYAD